MEIFGRIFLLSFCASAVLAGGDNYCHPFTTYYNNFLEKFLESVEQRKQLIISDIKNMTFYGNASLIESEITAANYYNFFINVTAELSGLSAQTVREVIDGSEQDIPSPLDCVYETFRIVDQVLREISTKTLGAVNRHRPPQVTEATNCKDVSSLFPKYAELLQDILEKRTKQNQIDAETFADFSNSLVDLNIAQNENQLMVIITALADALKIDASFVEELVKSHFSKSP